MTRIFSAIVNSFAAIGVALIVLGSLTWYARDDLAAWYRQLPVAVFAKCPGVK